MERLDTTNVILIVLAAASIVQTLLVIGVALGAMRAYQAATRTLDTRLTPLLLRLEGVLTNLEHTSAVVRTRTDDMSRAIDSVQNTAGRVSAVMWPRAAMVAGVAGGVFGVMKRWRAARREPGRAPRVIDSKQSQPTVVAG
jgi:hypothetical protein